MTTSSFDLGDVVTLHFELTVDDVLTNATVALTVTLPGGTTSTPAVSNPSTGVYEADYAPTRNGQHSYRWVATGAATAAEVGTFDVGSDYTSLAILKASLNITDTVDDTALLRAIAGASRRIDQLCGTTFYPITEARLFFPEDSCGVWVDRFRTTTGLVLKTGTDGTFDTTVTAADVLAWPPNAVATGSSYTKLVVPTGGLPCGYLRPTAEVTATWGWEAPPDPVVDACTLMAARAFRRKDSPEGVTGSSDFGIVRVSRYDDPDAMSSLGPYLDKVWV